MSDLGRVGTLPDDIITDILSRLPVESLLRFKDVYPWSNSLISHPDFIKFHNKRSKTQNPKNLDLNIIFMNPHQKNLYSVDFADVNPTIKTVEFPLVKEHSDGGKWILSSCDGLLLVMIVIDDNITNFLWNPSTGKCEKLPTPTFAPAKPLDIYWYLCGLGYDSSTDDYKVVMLSTCTSGPEVSTEHGFSIVGIYSLKADTWKRIQDTNYVLTDNYCGVFINGCVHCACVRAGGGSFLIVAFNLSDEVFKEVPLSDSIRTVSTDYVLNYRVAVLGGCLCLANHDRQHDKTDFWIMKEYGVKESWTKFTYKNRVEVLSLLAEDEFLLKAKGYKLVVYNSKKETSREMVINGFPKKFTFGSTYVESLVSPNRRGGIGRPWMRSFLRSGNPRTMYVGASSGDIGQPQVTSLSVRPPGIAVHG